jgi:DNA-3-methyladenine glycosylase
MSKNEIRNVFPRNLLQGEDTVSIAKQLLNQLLISNVDNGYIAARIVETEAYKAPFDKASHAYQNKYTERTKYMFGKAGTAYVYLCYGIHNMLNVVSGPQGKAHAILIRAIEPIIGKSIMMQRRRTKNEVDLCNGPGKLCRALGIGSMHNSIDLCNTDSPVWIASSERIDESEIIGSPRVGISYAEECALWPWRFRIKSNKWTSKPDRVSYKKA